MGCFPERPFKVLTQHSLSQTSQFQVGVLEGVFHLVVQRLLFALDHDGGAAVQNPLRGSLHHQQVLGLSRCCVLVDGELLDREEGWILNTCFVLPKTILKNEMKTTTRGRKFPLDTTRSSVLGVEI